MMQQSKGYLYDDENEKKYVTKRLFESLFSTTYLKKFGYR